MLERTTPLSRHAGARADTVAIVIAGERPSRRRAAGKPLKHEGRAPCRLWRNRAA